MIEIMDNLSNILQKLVEIIWKEMLRSRESNREPFEILNQVLLQPMSVIRGMAQILAWQKKIFL